MADARQLLLTSPFMGAIAVLLVRGRDARAILATLAGPKILHLPVGDRALVKIREPDGSDEPAMDEALVVAVADSSLELHLHGGVAMVERVMTLLEHAGAARVTEQDSADLVAAHTGGAWARGIAAEVLHILPQAQSRTAVRLLAAQHDEKKSIGLEGWATQWRQRLQADAPLWHFQSEAQWLLDRTLSLRWLLQRPRVAIVGPPNAGKSTLANALLGRNISITSDMAGTTRDWVDAAVTLGKHETRNRKQETGIPEANETRAEVVVTLVDTAGVRETSDPLEHESIQRTSQQLALADAVIAVIDGSSEIAVETVHWLRTLTQRPMVLAINKTDRGMIWDQENLDLAAPTLAISALHGIGIDPLMDHILNVLGVGDVGTDEPWAFTERQRLALQQAAVARNTVDALNQLAVLLGE